MPTTPTIKIINIDPRVLRELPTKNPEVMDPATYERLRENMRQDGCLQSLLLVEENGTYVIVDGVHRRDAAIEIGLDTVPALVAPDRGRAEILRIALNKTRGELDVSEVARQMQTLLDTGFTEADLVYTGFQDWEVMAMLDTIKDADAEDELLLGADTSPITPEKPKTFALTFKFTSDSERVRVREYLEQLADGNAMQGLINLIDGHSTD